MQPAPNHDDRDNGYIASAGIAYLCFLEFLLRNSELQLPSLSIPHDRHVQRTNFFDDEPVRLFDIIGSQSGDGGLQASVTNFLRLRRTCPPISFLPVSNKKPCRRPIPCDVRNIFFNLRGLLGDEFRCRCNL